MREELYQNEFILKLMKLIDKKDKSILELKSRVDGAGTCLRFLLARMKNNIVEGRIMTASNDFESFENKVDKICCRLDMLENELLLIYNK